MHYHAEQMVNGNQMEEPLSPEFKQASQIFDKILALGLRPLRAEVCIFHCGLRVAGQPDLLCVDSAGRIVIFDWKRTRRLLMDDDRAHMRYPFNELPDTNYWHYALQLNLYAFILESEYAKEVSGMFLAVVHPELAEPRLVAVPRLDEEVQALVEHEIAGGRTIGSVTAGGSRSFSDPAA